MSQQVTPGSGPPDEPASIERLPPELLLPIVSSLPDLDTLWNLMRASPHTFRFFHCHAIAAIEGILSGPKSILPPTVQELIRGVILARSNALPFKNLSDFQAHFMRRFLDLFPEEELELTPLGPGTLSVSNTTVAALLSVVATAYQVSALSQACLASCLERSRALQVLHPVDPKICYTDDFDHPDEMIRAFDRKYPLAPAKMADAGQPTWMEEMRAVRAIWTIQMVGEMRRLSANKANMSWPEEDIDSLNQMDLIDLLRAYRSNYGGEEIKSAMEYLTTLGEMTNDVYHRLPRPAPASPVTRWTTALPIPEDTTLVVCGYVKDRMIHRLALGSPVPAGCRPMKVPKYSKDYSWGRTKTSLMFDSFGVDFFREFTRNGVSRAESPIAGVRFDCLRPFGFAFWDRWRMHLLGLAPPVHIRNHHFYYFAWESILPSEEVKNVKNELRDEWWRSMAFYNSRLAASHARER
ncbi:hypothetical protein LCI18_013325 [Fusarium solani-melongenae]|uniref:Uncharacterized protein n=1 Tax=Fusarium solani subsp. cucurbitae TaxID=2747967 RepID=A0ACD3ZMD9_FUSSC|nr:hypothetical protein LCI18_013325 [Fusarium solani-melongenae]